MRVEFDLDAPTEPTEFLRLIAFLRVNDFPADTEFYLLHDRGTCVLVSVQPRYVEHGTRYIVTVHLSPREVYADLSDAVMAELREQKTPDQLYNYWLENLKPSLAPERGNTSALFLWALASGGIGCCKHPVARMPGCWMLSITEMAVRALEMGALPQQ
jgi:hypothetical protein